MVRSTELVSGFLIIQRSLTLKIEFSSLDRGMGYGAFQRLLLLLIKLSPT